ncbi:MAG TPA: ribonuclease P protein component [Anaerolineae bacterium]|nr:ribonuclease P protein component [Anaerolineae bacterium]HCK66220.1 ribonuclease P protein component [Anaerolineae bacterium]HCR71905.1 ribonuclease P protein component [Anaerolineae bacterium]
MQRRFRLSRAEDFKRVRQTGKSFAHPLVVLVIKANESKDNLRVGVTAGKTTGSAVHRNRAKRLLREAMRPLLPNIASGFDLILIARPKLVTSTLTETRSALINLFQRANILLPLNES